MGRRNDERSEVVVRDEKKSKEEEEDDAEKEEEAGEGRWRVGGDWRASLHGSGSHDSDTPQARRRRAKCCLPLLSSPAPGCISQGLRDRQAGDQLAEDCQRQDSPGDEEGVEEETCSYECGELCEIKNMVVIRIKLHVKSLEELLSVEFALLVHLDQPFHPCVYPDAHGLR